MQTITNELAYNTYEYSEGWVNFARHTLRWRSWPPWNKTGQEETKTNTPIRHLTCFAKKLSEAHMEKEELKQQRHEERNKSTKRKASRCPSETELRRNRKLKATTWRNVSNLGTRQKRAAKENRNKQPHFGTSQPTTSRINSTKWGGKQRKVYPLPGRLNPSSRE